MKFVAQTIAGMEDISIKEISELIDAEAEKLQEGRIIFDTTHQKAKGLLQARSIFKVYEIIQELDFTTLEDLTSKVKEFEFEDPFVVRCQREGEHEFQSLDAEKEIGAVFYHAGHAVDLHNPKTTIIADIINNKCFIGKDLTADKAMSKREYRVKAHPKSINACLAYCAIRSSGWTKDKTLLDPNCKDGIIAIEAALAGGTRITATDPRITSIKAAQTNSKIAGVSINFTEEFKGTADYIITTIPRPGKFFGTAEKTLAKDGTILIISQSREFNPVNFKLVSEREVRVHKAMYFLLTFKAA